MDRRRLAHDRGLRVARGSGKRRPAVFLAALAAVTAAVVAASAGATSTGGARETATALSAGDAPYAITSGPDGNLWFTVPLRVSPTQALGNKIGRITLTGAITEFSAGSSGAIGLGGMIAAGPDGNLWFTDGAGNDRVRRITPTGKITEFRDGISASSGPVGITVGPDGNLWFTETDGNRIGRITPAGAVTEFSVGISPKSGPAGITAGPDGNLWFIETDGNRIGRVTPAGTVTEFRAGIGANSGLRGIATGPDGNLWFTEFDGNRIGRITPKGTVTRFRVGISAGSGPAGITSGPDGNLWFTEFGGRIGRITPAGVVSEYPPTAAILGIRQRGTSSVVVRVRCPSGAARACRGTARLLGPRGLNDRQQRISDVPRFRVAPGRRDEVIVQLATAARRQLRARGKLNVTVMLVPSTRSAAGAVARDVVMRVPRSG